MKILLLALAPLALYAQVTIDTVIRLPDSILTSAVFLPELNKLYIASLPDEYIVLNCSTYQYESLSVSMLGFPHYSWNWRRQKLYATCNPKPDSTLVIDAAADSVIRWLTVCYEMHTDIYLSDIDHRYKPAGDTVYEFECDADTVVRRLQFGGYGGTCASWDSVGRKLYVGLLRKLYAYDYVAESLLKVIDVSSIYAVQPDAVVFNNTCHRGYVAPFQPEPWEAHVGIIDTERDSLVSVLPVRIWGGLHSQVAVDERDDKVYLADNDTRIPTPDTLWVVDCATDSVIKKVEYAHRGQGAMPVRWVPWSNRLYLAVGAPDSLHGSALTILDCNTDSVIASGVLANDGDIQIQLDPVRERIFVIGVDRSCICVLRDTGYGINEAAPTGPRPGADMQLRTTAGGYEVSFFVERPCCVDLSVYDRTGREVRQLAAGQQQAGQYRVFWDCTDNAGDVVARGVYYVRLDTPGFRDVKKAVMAR
jgi:hypothetical protein